MTTIEVGEYLGGREMKTYVDLFVEQVTAAVEVAISRGEARVVCDVPAVIVVPTLVNRRAKEIFCGLVVAALSPLETKFVTVRGVEKAVITILGENDRRQIDEVINLGKQAMVKKKR